MTVNESIFEDVGREWFLSRQGFGGQVGDLGYALGHGPHLAPGEPAAEREPGQTGIVAKRRWTCTFLDRTGANSRRQSFGEVMLVGRLREAIRRLNPATPILLRRPGGQP